MNTMALDDSTGRNLESFERRCAPRVPSSRRGLYEHVRGGLPVVCTIADIGHGGMRLVSAKPAATGVVVEVESPPDPLRPGSGPIHMRGMVVYTLELDRGEHAMGLRLVNVPIAPVAAAISASLQPPPTNMPCPHITARAPDSQSQKQSANWLRGSILALLVAVLLLLIWTLDAPEKKRRASVNYRSASKNIPKAPQLAGKNRADNEETTGPESPAPTATSDAYLPASMGHRTVARRDIGIGAPYIPLAALAPAILETQPVARAVDTGDEAPPGTPGQFDGDSNPISGADLLLNGQGGDTQAISLDPRAIEHAHVESFALPREIVEVIEQEPVVVLIDKRDYRLIMFVDGTAMRAFPVGLGRDSATPEGRFTIGIKISDPDWSDRGRVVPAGAPDNPLGRRWIGLARDNLTSYGIHSTYDTATLGRDASRGCIRMMPAHIETLFTLCPVGTPVFVLR